MPPSRIGGPSVSHHRIVRLSHAPKLQKVSPMSTATTNATIVVPQRSWYRRNEIAITPWLFLAPGVLFFTVYVMLPIFQSFNLSLYDWNGLGSVEQNGTYVGLDNYVELMGDRNFEISMWNNAKWLLMYLLAIPGGLFIALFLNQTVRGIRLYKSLFFFPFVLSQVVVGLVFSWFYLPNEGLLNQILGWFGSDGVNVLGDPTLATYGIIVAGLWPQTAYCMILYLTGLNAVDPEQVEAARLDGAKSWKMLWYIIIPQLKPATFIAFVVTIIGALRSFDLISVMTNGGPFGRTRVLSFYVWEKSLSERGLQYGYAAAIAVVLFLIMLCFIAYFLWSMYRDEKSGG
ncbi:MAG: multiple sugar transport system permease protein [Paracoccaceae bacterium]